MQPPLAHRGPRAAVHSPLGADPLETLSRWHCWVDRPPRHTLARPPELTSCSLRPTSSAHTLRAAQAAGHLPASPMARGLGPLLFSTLRMPTPAPRSAVLLCPQSPWPNEPTIFPAKPASHPSHQGQGQGQKRLPPSLPLPCVSLPTGCLSRSQCRAPWAFPAQIQLQEASCALAGAPSCPVPVPAFSPPSTTHPQLQAAHSSRAQGPGWAMLLMTKEQEAQRGRYYTGLYPSPRRPLSLEVTSPLREVGWSTQD